jgi:hypothetical protein
MMTTFSTRTLRYAKQYRVVRRPSATIIECPQRRALMMVHPLLDRAEGMLDHLPPPVENFRSRFQSRRHAVEHRLVFQTRDLAIVLGARLDRANETRRPIAVIDLRQFPQLAFIARRQDLAGRTDERRAPRRSRTHPCGQSHCSPMIPAGACEHTASSPPSRRPRCPRS